ncbi:hypothetical protein EDC31_101366 [Acidomonas methanolica]|nr:hypothetical protein EDC31_101366 [Acidomonas methanolica]
MRLTAGKISLLIALCGFRATFRARALARSA